MFLVASVGRTDVPVMAALTVSLSACVSHTVVQVVVRVSSAVRSPILLSGALCLAPMVRLSELTSGLTVQLRSSESAGKIAAHT
jgi:hypothetical protein